MSTFNIGNGVLKSALNQTFLQTQAEDITLLNFWELEWEIIQVLTCEFEAVVGSPKIKIGC